MYAQSSLATITLLFALTGTEGFQQCNMKTYKPSNLVQMMSSDDGENFQCADQKKIVPSRRAFLENGFTAVSASFALASLTGTSANAIDVSGLRVEGGSSGSGNIAQQLKAYDSSPSMSSEPKMASSTPVTSPATKIDSSIAVSAKRSVTSPPILKKSALGTIARFEENIEGPPGSKKKYVYVSFEFPSDWLQLDRVLGGVQFVDQRNGDKVYLLTSKLPNDTDLSTAPKQFFADSIFDPKGSISSGINIDEYKVSSSSLSSQIVNCPQSGACSSTRRRLKLKYATVTGNGLRVERRGLVDVYEVDGWAYMLLTTQNAVKFEAKGKERETIDNIVDSFRLEA